MVFGSVTNLFPPKFNIIKLLKFPISSGILSRLQKLMSRYTKHGTEKDNKDHDKPHES